MKKLSIIFGLALAMLTVGCSTDATEDLIKTGTVEIGVNIEEPTRTYLGALDGKTYPVLWSEGDKVAVNGVASAAVGAQYAGTASAIFEVADVAAPYNVLYPAEVLNADGSITVPTEQAYTAGSFANGSAVLVGYAESTSVALHNLYSFVKITVAKGDDVALKSVTLRALGGEAISGTFAVDYKNAAISALAGKDLIRVSSAEGIPYVDGKASVIIAVPAGKYAGGFSVKIVDAAGKAMEKKAYTTAGIEVPAGVLLNMPELTYVGAEQSVVTVYNVAELLAAFATVTAETPANIVLGGDLDMTDASYAPVEAFYGTFDGQGYSVKNWNTNRGLIIENFGTVKNVVIDASCTITAAFEGTGDKNLGFVVENNAEPGFVLGCVNNGKVVATDISCAGHRIGSICGVSYGTVHDCINNGDVDVTSATIGNNHNVGGVVGYCNPNAGTKDALGTEFLANCINNGNVTVVFPCQPKKVNVGGVLGGTQNAASSTCAYLGTIKNCINNGDVKYRFEILNSGTYGNVGGVVGYAQVDLVGCDNYGRVEYSTPTDPSAAGTRAAAGGVIGCNVFGIEDCNNYGELFVEGVWAAGTNDAAAAGSQAGSSFGGVVGCVGIYNAYSADYPTIGCNNYGEVNLTVYCKTAGGTAGHFGGVLGYSTNDVKDCHNNGKVNIKTFLANTYAAGVVAYTTADVDNVTNNETVNIETLGVTTSGKTLYLSGVIGRAKNITACANNGATTLNVKPCEIGISTIYTGGVAGYADVKIENSTLNAPFSLTTDDHTASLRCAGIVGQVKTGTAPMNTVINCNTTAKASVSLVTKNTKANYIGGIIGNCNNGLDGCTNEAPINVTIAEANTGTAITYIAGIAGLQKETLSNSHNKANITADMANSTAPLYAATIVACNYAATCVVKDCTNSGNLTITNTASTDQQIGIIGGSNATTEDGGAVTFENCTSTGVVTVNGAELGSAAALSIDGKRWQLPADIAAEITGVATAVVVADLGVTTPGMLYIAVDYESVYGAQAAGMWAPMVQAAYTIEATDATSGNIVLATTDHFGDTVKTNVPYSNLTEESVTIDCTNMIGMPGNGPCTIYTGEVNLSGGGVM